jgi:DNA replication and repair protein RecF
MRAASLAVRSVRNLTDAELTLPPTGIALLGPNGHGKTNLLEALAYPVLFRSLRGARDAEVARFGGPGFHIGLTRGDGRVISATWEAVGARKRVTVDGVDCPRITDALGHWLAVAFLPTDLGLVQGGAAERRRWLDRMLSLAHPAYLAALLRYRAAVAQRNAALRRADAVSAAAFDGPMAASGAVVLTRRLAWADAAGRAWREALGELGEPLAVELRYRGNTDLADAAAWPDVLGAQRDRDAARGQTHAGPHRDDLTLGLGGHSLRRYGSTGQHRTAAIGLRLLEHATLVAACGAVPALLVDDVFAELDTARQERLATRLGAMGAQLVVTAPREADLPEALEVPRWHVDDGRIMAA